MRQLRVSTMTPMMGILYLAAFLAGLFILRYAISAVAETAQWYATRRRLAGAYDLRKGLSIDEARQRMQVEWQHLDRELTSEGEVSRYVCNAEDGAVLLLYFLNDRLFSWQITTESDEEENPDS